MEEEKRKYILQSQYKIQELEEQKIKSDFKAKVLENENKKMFTELIGEIKKSKQYFLKIKLKVLKKFL